MAYSDSIREAKWKLANALRSDITMMSDAKTIFIAYALYRYSDSEESISDSVKKEQDDEVKMILGNACTAAEWRAVNAIKGDFDQETLKGIILENDDEYATPKGIVNLALQLLDINKKDAVADICCGSGNFIIPASEKYPKNEVDGFEINVETGNLAYIRSIVAETKVHIKYGDVLDILGAKKTEKRYDKIFSNYPFGLRLKMMGYGQKYIDELTKEIPTISKATSSDWIYNALIVDQLSENGRAVAIMTNGSTFNSIDKAARQYFVENGLIETIISLPSRMFNYSNIPTTLMVFSKKHNEVVRLVDATNEFTSGRRVNEFTVENIENIINAVRNDTEISKTLTIKEIRENEFFLSSGRYFSNTIEFKNGVKFESVIKKLTRGAALNASKLDEIASEEVTDYQYLMLANIKDGMIDEELPYITEIEDRFEKYCLKNNMLIISKNGYPYKVAVADIKEGQKILANGNLYLIEIDEEKANPHYIKAFFDSETGIEVLKSITVGATIPNIAAESLKKVMIPLPSMDEQNRIAEKYRAKLDEIAVLKIKLEKAKNKLKEIFDDESGVESC